MQDTDITRNPRHILNLLNQIKQLLPSSLNYNSKENPKLTKKITLLFFLQTDLTSPDMLSTQKFPKGLFTNIQQKLKQ